jgi:1-acyl-sn-glycerol-3-phosphate acyltransferase
MYLPARDATGGHRRELAQAAHDAVAAGLGIAAEPGGLRPHAA